MASPQMIKFGVFELDLHAGELRKQGHKIRLQEQPFRLLAAVLERPGEVVTREDLARRLWNGNTQVDFDNGLNIAARKLRQALGDDAEAPRYLETVPRRGYRFIATPGPVVLAPVAENAHQMMEAPNVAAAHRHHLPWRWFGLMAVAMVAVTLMVFRVAPNLHPPRVARVTQLTRTGHAEVGSGIATDGARVYFIERTGGIWRVAQVSAAGGTPSALPGPFNAPDVLAISPQRSELLIADYNNVDTEAALWILPTIGGQAWRIPGVAGHAATWSRDGSSVIFAKGAALFRVDRAGNGLRQLVEMPGLPASIRWSPAGFPELLSIGLWGQEASRSLWTSSPDGRNLRAVLPDWKSSNEMINDADYADWTADGRYLLFRSMHDGGSTAWAQRIRPGLLHRFDRPIQIYATPMQFATLAPSPVGSKVFLAAGQERRETLRYDARQKQFVPFLSGIPIRWINFSGDGQRVTYVTIPDGDLWQARADGSQARQLTFAPLHALEPHWSPDGRRIAFHGCPYGGQFKVYVVAAAGGPLETVTPSNYADYGPWWSPDGQSLMFHRAPVSGNAGEAGVYIMDLQTRKATRLPGSQALERPTWSPDGRYATAMDRQQIFRFDFRTQEWSLLAHGHGLSPPFWSRDGQYIYYQDNTGTIEQPIYRVRARTGEVQLLATSRQIPQASLLGYTLTGLSPEDAPLATVLRTNFDIYSMDLDLP